MHDLANQPFVAGGRGGGGWWGGSELQDMHACILIYTANSRGENKTDQFLGASMASSEGRFVVKQLLL